MKQLQTNMKDMLIEAEEKQEEDGEQMPKSNIVSSTLSWLK